ncbi:MAG: MBL fold metallo-hydrolase [candidate division Zixibacteria bacterium]|nr:MBL fold metallo-hydrolase [Candidatus Tariuqbacter arcticus]
MKVKFWGVRGSLPTPLTSPEVRKKLISAIWKARSLSLDNSPEAKLEGEQTDIISAFLDSLPIEERGTIGGNTPCVQIIPDDGELIIVDCGSGLRALGSQLMQDEFGLGEGKASIFLSHTHWDHICGLPFFTPIFIKGNRLNFYGGHDNLEDRLRSQHNPWHFPVPWNVLGADKKCVQISPDSPFNIGNTRVIMHELSHPGRCFSYRFEGEDGDVIIYASDAEYKHLQHSKVAEYIEFFQNADILIFDTQYTLTEALAKEDWGHSSAMIGIEMAMEANVRNLVMFHHEPTYDDEKIVSLCKKTDQYQQILNNNSLKCNIHIAYEGLVLTTENLSG